MNKIDQASLDQFRALFRGRSDWYGHRDFDTNKQWTEGSRDASGQLMRDARGNVVPPPPLTDEHFHRHFNKIVGLGLIPIRADGRVNFAALDIDKDDIDHVELARKIKDMGLPLWVFVSRSLAAHAYFFSSGEGRPAKEVVKRLEDYGTALGCGRTYPKAEIFPKQQDLEDPDMRVGNYINLPFFNEFSPDQSDIRGKFVTSEGEFLGLHAFLERVKPWDPDLALPLPVRSMSFDQGPPCLETLHQQGIPSGMRNNGLYNVGVFLKKYDPDCWEEKLHAYNQKYMECPVSGSELRTIVKSLKKKEYQYKCKEDPIASVCEKDLCKKRLYGIKTKEERLLEQANRLELPIEGLIKYNSDPVTWGLKVEGHIVNVAAKELLNYNALRAYLLDVMSVVPPAVKPDVWEVKVRDLVANAEVVEVAEDAGELSHIKDLIDQFVFAGSTSEAMINAMSAYVQYHPDRGGSEAYLTTKSLREYLIGMKVNFTLNRLSVMLNQTGWESTVQRFDGSPKRCWKKFYPGLEPSHAAVGEE